MSQRHSTTRLTTLSAPIFKGMGPRLIAGRPTARPLFVCASVEPALLGSGMLCCIQHERPLFELRCRVEFYAGAENLALRAHAAKNCEGFYGLRTVLGAHAASCVCRYGTVSLAAQCRHPAANPVAAVAARTPEVRCDCKIWSCEDSQSADVSDVHPIAFNDCCQPV